MNDSNSKTAPRRLRDLLEGDDPVLMAGVWDALGTKLAQSTGFPCVYLGGSATAASFLGRTDIGYLTAETLATVLRNITQTSSLPVLVDGDDGFGNPLNVRHTVELLEQAGAAGVSMEDVVLPKHLPKLGDWNLLDADAMARKVEAAVAARRDDDFVVCARTDFAEGVTVEEAARRGKLYAEAGADAFWANGVPTKEDAATLAAEVGLPFVFAQITDYAPPPLTRRDLEEIPGTVVAVYPQTPYVAAYPAAERALRELITSLEDPDTEPALGGSVEEVVRLWKLVGLDEDAELARVHGVFETS